MTPFPSLRCQPTTPHFDVANRWRRLARDTRRDRTTTRAPRGSSRRAQKHFDARARVRARISFHLLICSRSHGRAEGTIGRRDAWRASALLSLTRARRRCLRQQWREPPEDRQKNRTSPHALRGRDSAQTSAPGAGRHRGASPSKFIKKTRGRCAPLRPPEQTRDLQAVFGA